MSFSSIYIYDKNGKYLTQKSLVGKTFVNQNGQVETITNTSMTGLTAFNGKIFSVYKSLYVCKSDDFGDSWTYVSEIKGIDLNSYELEGLFVLMTEFGLAISNDNGETFSPFLAKEIGKTPLLPLLWESNGKRSLFFAIPGEVNSSSFVNSYIDVVEIKQQDLSALPFINGRTYSIDTSTNERSWPFIRIGKDFIIQHGSWPLAQTLAANSIYTVNLTFPVPFYDYDYNLIVSYYGANMNNNILVGVDSQTPTGAVIKIKNISGSATSNPVNCISWIALGKPQ